MICWRLSIRHCNFLPIRQTSICHGSNKEKTKRMIIHPRRATRTGAGRLITKDTRGTFRCLDLPPRT
jgi:hypothetical protein